MHQNLGQSVSPPLFWVVSPLPCSAVFCHNQTWKGGSLGAPLDMLLRVILVSASGGRAADFSLAIAVLQGWAINLHSSDTAEGRTGGEKDKQEACLQDETSPSSNQDIQRQVHCTIVHSCIQSYSCTQLYTVVYSCKQLYTVVYSHKQLYTVVHSCTQLYTVVYSCTQLYTVVHSCSQLYTIVVSWTKLYTVVHSCTQL